MSTNESFLSIKQHLSGTGYLTEEALSAGSIGGMSKEEVRQTLDQMIERGLVVWKKPIPDSSGRVQIQGRWALTLKGRTADL